MLLLIHRHACSGTNEVYCDRLKERGKTSFCIQAPFSVARGLLERSDGAVTTSTDE